MAPEQVDVEMRDAYAEADEPTSKANILEIPLEADGEAVTIDLDNDLPDDPSEICVLLENEKCAAEYWLAIGTAYARNGQAENAIEVVSKGLAASSHTMRKESDKIPFYSCLAWLHLRQMREAPVTAPEGDATFKTKEDYHRLAMEAGTKAYELDRSWSVNVLARGALMSAIGNFDEALSPFQAVLTQTDNANLFAQLGRARILYHRKNYKCALQIYQNVLLARPSMVHPDPRIGIGLCFWRLNDKTAAFEAWSRSNELSQGNSASVNTLLGLYFVDQAFHHEPSSPTFFKDFSSDYSQALQHFQIAYKSNSNYPAASITLASYFFSKQSFDSVIKLGTKAISYTDMSAILSDGYFWMGRAYHSMGDSDKALEYYTLAESKNSGSVLPRIGKGLVLMSQDSPEALLTFESIVGTNPRSVEGVLLLGLMHAQRAGGDTKRTQRAIVLLEKYLSLAKEAQGPDQEGSADIVPESLVILSQLYESTNVDKALLYLKQAVGDVGTGGSVSAHISNNLGVLSYLSGNFDAAQSYFETARQTLETSSEGTDDEGAEVKRLEITVAFNHARLHDAKGHTEEARKGYADVLERAPDYLDARVRLTYLSVVHGDESASDELQQLMADHGDNLEVRALYGWYLRRKKTSVAKNMNEDQEQKHYKRSLVDYNKHDSYSLVAMGNLYLAVAREIRVKGNSDVEKKEKSYFKAAEFFDKALQLDQYDAYAAQGIAIIFAETKRPELALHIFSKIRETLNDMSIYINLGHCMVELKQFSKAVEAYEFALRKANSDDLQLFTLLGRAWYIRGVTEHNVEALRISLQHSEKALAKAPTNLGLRFNVAFIQFQLADEVRRTPSAKRTMAEIEGAIEILDKAIKELHEIAEAERPPFPSNDLEQRSLMGQNTMRKQLERALGEQEEYEQKNASKLEEARKARLEAQSQLAAEARIKAEEEEKREQALVEQRRVLQEEAKQWAATVMAEAEERAKVEEEEADAKAKAKKEKGTREPRKAGAKGGRKKKTEDAAAKPETTSGSRKKFKSDEFINDSSEESAVSGASDGEDGASDGAQSESDDEKKRKSEDDGEANGATKKRKVVKRVVADSDEEDEEEAAAVTGGNADLFGDDD